MKININHLYQFFLTAKEGSIKKAAKILHLTEPTISKQIKDLEAFLEANLFRRVNNQLELTALGEEVSKRAEKIFQSVDEIEFFLGKKTSGVGNRLRLGATPLLYPYMIRFFDMNFQAAKIEEVVFHCASSGELEEDLQKNKIDLAICDYPLSLDDYYCQKAIDSDLIIVGNKDYRSKEKEFPYFLEGESFVSLNRNCKIQEDIDQMLDVLGVEIKKSVRVDNFETARDCVLRGLGLTVVPTHIVAGDIASGRLKKIGSLEGVSLSVWLVSLNSRLQDPSIKLAIQHTYPQDPKTFFSLR